MHYWSVLRARPRPFAAAQSSVGRPERSPWADGVCRCSEEQPEREQCVHRCSGASIAKPQGVKFVSGFCLTGTSEWCRFHFRTFMLSGIGSASIECSASPSSERALSQRSVRLSRLWRERRGINLVKFNCFFKHSIKPTRNSNSQWSRHRFINETAWVSFFSMSEDRESEEDREMILSVWITQHKLSGKKPLRVLKILPGPFFIMIYPPHPVYHESLTSSTTTEQPLIPPTSSHLSFLLSKLCCLPLYLLTL